MEAKRKIGNFGVKKYIKEGENRAIVCNVIIKISFALTLSRGIIGSAANTASPETSILDIPYTSILEIIGQKNNIPKQ